MMEGSMSSSISIDSMGSLMYETPEAKKLRREFRRQQVELMELRAVGLGLALQETCHKLDMEWNCLKRMDSLNLNISNHSSRGSVTSTGSRPRRAFSTPAVVPPQEIALGARLGLLVASRRIQSVTNTPSSLLDTGMGRPKFHSNPQA
ncbi:expressed unknown protein [Seminavis robusta]|uniref:Uncharacterized protein n=1 Tax=Seminavis robusta TaxID=568900 RepID=A0A9N8D558_9STRA|nr:expressed unknown protein [Seminavis robusta]|eukprot:Sro3_g002440.1 n/a (148) ;mRNA; r:157269-157712